MIEQQQAMAVIVEACPSFSGAWEEHVREYGNDVLYVAAGSLASHLLSLHLANETECFLAVGQAIERLHTEGSAWVKEFATVGILEGVQNVWSNNGADPEHFHRYLGNESKIWWQSLNDFWSGKVLHVGRGV